MAFRRHFSRVGSAERCTETIFTDHQRQVCDYALVYAEKKNDGEAPYSVSFTATQSGDVIVQLHPHSQLERAVRHERQAQATGSRLRARALRRRPPLPPRRQPRSRRPRRTPPRPHRSRRVPPRVASPPRLRARPPPRACRRRPAAAECAAAPSLSLTRAGSVGSSSAARAAVPGAVPMLDPVSLTRTRCPRAAAGPRASRARRRPTLRPPSGPPPLTRPAMKPIRRTRCSRRRSAGYAARSA